MSRSEIDSAVCRWSTLPMVTALALGAVVLVIFVVMVLTAKSRRGKELRSGPLRFHWAAIAAYRGDADPTALDQKSAAEIIQNDWSCPSVERLRQMLRRYATGEVNAAFDAVRVLWLAELGASAGWITVREVAEWSFPACDRLRKAYSSWPAYEAAVIEGRDQWWATIAKRPLPASEQTRALEIRQEAAAIFQSVAWG